MLDEWITVILYQAYMRRKLCCFFIICFLMSISLFIPTISQKVNVKKDSVVIAGFDNSLLIPPQDEYILKYSPSSQSFSKVTEPLTSSLSEKIQNAIVKVPDWLKTSLLYQFEYLDDPFPYVDLILNSERKITDELAFCIAHAPLGKLPEPKLLLQNVHQIYAIDDFISYADIIEINENKSTYYSTIQYTILSENTSVTCLLPKEIYYWYIVHPQILSETPEIIYDTFWRSYMVNHNDIGYPLLLEKIENISFLWDEESYHQPAHRDWRECISLHPTAIEAVSYWIGKTVPYEAAGDRPGQPNLIAHQHNGWCGELQRIAVAGLRSVLIPSISICNIAEDHVWRAFYHDGWRQNDNWWSDTGGTVDEPMVYSEGWGKDMSSVFSWRGDGVVTDMTSTYIGSNDTVNVSFYVSDITNHPLDGARVTVLVKGLKDITWYKNKFLNILECLWYTLPEKIRESFLDRFYSGIVQRVENISDVVDGLTISIWNYSNEEGYCTFTLGSNDEYVFLIQQPIDSLPFPLASWTSVRFLKNPGDTSFSIRFPKVLSEKIPSEIIEFSEDSSENNIQASLSLNSIGVQYQANVRTNDLGQYTNKCPISFFVLNQEQYIKYVNNEDFSSLYYKKDNIINEIFNMTEQPYYLIFYNPTQNIIANVDIQLLFSQKTDKANVIILQPSTTLFDHPYFQVGDCIHIKGISSEQSQVSINNLTHIISSGFWDYHINTTSWIPDTYTLKASCESKEIMRNITLIDNSPPHTTIETPAPYKIVPPGEIIQISGISRDNYQIDSVFIGVDNTNWKTCEGTDSWNSIIETNSISPGIHNISLKSIDASGNQEIIHQPIIINDTINIHKPHIHSIEWLPIHPTNNSNIIINTNISTESTFPLKNAYIELTINELPETFSRLYEYGQNPVQGRHVEDPKQNLSNNPVLGLELGTFDYNDTIRFRIIAIDVAKNMNRSAWETITIK